LSEYTTKIKDNTALHFIVKTKGGSVPQELWGHFTTQTEANKAIARFYALRESKVEEDKVKKEVKQTKKD